MTPASGHIALKVTGFTNHLARFEARLPRHARTLERLHLAGSLCTVSAAGGRAAENAVKLYGNGGFEDTGPLLDTHFIKLNDFYGPPVNWAGRVERERFNPKAGRGCVRLEFIYPVAAVFPDTASSSLNGNMALFLPVNLEARRYRFTGWARTDATLDGHPACLCISGLALPNALVTPAMRADGNLGTQWREYTFEYDIPAPGLYGLLFYVQGGGSPNPFHRLWLDGFRAAPAEGAFSVTGQGDALARVVFSSNRLREFGQFVLNRREADTVLGSVSPTDTYKLHAVPEYPVVEGYVERFDLALDTVWMLVEYTEDPAFAQ